jgi:hypothetical protein
MKRPTTTRQQNDEGEETRRLEICDEGARVLRLIAWKAAFMERTVLVVPFSFLSFTLYETGEL